MNCFGVFLKEPQAGKVKTRLVADGVDQDLVLKLYNAFLNDTLDLIQQASADLKLAFIAPGASTSFIQQVQQKKFEVLEQQGDDLGQRMAHFFQTAFEKGAQKVVLIGTDSPSLPIDFLREALNRLDQSEVVLGPSTDGGYYLIGMSSFYPEVFQGITWSSETVLEETLSVLEKLNKLEKVHLLPFWYDIDQKKELQFLITHLKILSQSDSASFPTATWQVLQELFEPSL